MEITDKKEIEAVFWQRSFKFQHTKRFNIIFWSWLSLPCILVICFLTGPYSAGFYLSDIYWPLIYTLCGLTMLGMPLYYGYSAYFYYKKLKSERLLEIERSSQLLQEK